MEGKTLNHKALGRSAFAKRNKNNSQSILYAANRYRQFKVSESDILNSTMLQKEHQHFTRVVRFLSAMLQALYVWGLFVLMTYIFEIRNTFFTLAMVERLSTPLHAYFTCCGKESRAERI